MVFEIFRGVNYTTIYRDFTLSYEFVTQDAIA